MNDPKQYLYKNAYLYSLIPQACLASGVEESDINSTKFRNMISFYIALLDLCQIHIVVDRTAYVSYIDDLDAYSSDLLPSKAHITTMTDLMIVNKKVESANILMQYYNCISDTLQTITTPF